MCVQMGSMMVCRANWRRIFRSIFLVVLAACGAMLCWADFFLSSGSRKIVVAISGTLLFLLVPFLVWDLLFVSRSYRFGGDVIMRVDWFGERKHEVSEIDRIYEQLYLGEPVYLDVMFVDGARWRICFGWDGYGDFVAALKKELDDCTEIPEVGSDPDT